MSMAKTIRGRGLFVMALGLAWTSALGCGQPLNESNGLLGVEPLPFLQTQTTSLLNASPSLDDPTRKSWPQVTVQVPIHQTQHELLYRKSPVLVDDLARQRGEFPSVGSALQTRPMGAGHWAEAAVEWTSPVFGLVDYGAALISGHGPWTVRTGPAIPYQRVPPVQALPDEDHLRFQMEAE